MGIGSLFGHLVKGKVLAMTAAGAILLGGTTAAMASTSTGQEIIHTITGAHDMKPTGQHTPGGQRPDDAMTGKKGTSADNHKRECPGLPEAQKLAATFSLSTASTSDDIQAICSLHEGTFHGKTANGSALSAERVLGYGEIDKLLTYAQYLAGGKLTDSNVRTYLAEALQSCGTTPLAVCVKNNMADSSKSGKNDTHGKSDTTPHGGDHTDKTITDGSGNSSNTNNKNADGNDSGKGSDKPASTPTASVHRQGGS